MVEITDIKAVIDAHFGEGVFESMWRLCGRCRTCTGKAGAHKASSSYYDDIDERAELWRDIPEFDGYQASSEGRIRSKDRFVRRKSKRGTEYMQLIKGKILKGALTGRGNYWRVNLYHSNSQTVHSLVARAFIGPRPKGMDVAHLDGNAGNNRPSNLAYKTRRDNNLDRARTGKTKATPDMVREARDSSLGASALARKLGMSPTWVYAVRKGLCRVAL